jgi:hypothetical protein
MIKKIVFGMALLALVSSCNSSAKKNSTDQKSNPMNAAVHFVHDSENKKVAVYFGDQLFTNYLYVEDYYKPVLHPLITKSGQSLTRGYPIEPQPNERVDHPHHVGYWLNYGDVNGYDFWNHSDAIPADKKEGYGTVFPVSFEVDEAKGKLSIVTEWKAPDGTVLIEEHTDFVFSEKDNHRFIDRTSTLHAKEEVSLTDNKEGFLGIRVSRALEHPSTKPEIFTDANGIPSEVKVLNNEGVTGQYLSSEGIKGDDVWGTRGKWVALNGIQNGEAVAITIYDHPENLGYPTYWHARGYGLFAANPLGQKIFSEGALELNASIPKGEKLTFKFRVMISDGAAVDAALANQNGY